MNNKQRKRQRDIKNKLMAAICMLLVSSIMMVSSTYAWFTLSTAPEVTGIDTAVGANGNLEMVLLPESGDIAHIAESTTGDGALENVTAKNRTWGNLVDLKDTSYGLGEIRLYPAALNASVDDAATKNPERLENSMLKTPKYGADGRISELEASTVTGVYADGTFTQNDAKYGVRAVGNASSMSPRELIYRNARSQASSYMYQATKAAQASLINNGSALASIAVKKAGSEADPTFTAQDITNLKTIANDLLTIVGYIENAYRQNIIAMGASNAVNLDEGAFTALQLAVAVAPDPAGLIDVLTPLTENTFKTNITTYLNALQATKTKVTTAKNDLEPLGEGATWSDLSGIVANLANPNDMLVNGYTPTEAKDHLAELIGGVTITVKTGGGAYADVADHCGNYTANVVVNAGTFQNIPLTNVPATMQVTTTAVGAPYLPALAILVGNAGAPGAGAGGAAVTISDTYGYVIDLAFRTNAASSNLLLQKDAADRIYNGENADTMGHGSTMTFGYSDVDGGFDADQVKELMKSIRIVFFDPGDKDVMATAKLDTDTITDDTTGKKLTAKMYLYKMETADNGSGGTVTREREETVITALDQNQIKRVSVLVYLDGENVTNEDVAAQGTTSMDGTMNLQFASSATLTPMEYTPLMVPTETTQAGEP